MRVLVGDDQPDVLEAARLLLKSGGHVAVTAGTPEAVLHEARSQPFDLLLVDMNYARDTTSGGEGLDLLEGLRASGISAPVVVMTAWGSVDLAVQAMRRGATDFVEKPWDNERLLDTIGQHGMKAQRARTDIEIARSVQQKLLGRAGTAVVGLDYAGSCLPMGDIGGDYFDFIDTPDSGLGIALADVSGKGIAAALLMAHLQAALRSRLDLADNPAALIDSINHVFWQSSPAEQYATLFYGVYHPTTRTLTYVNAGHATPVVVHPDGACELLESTGTPVGLFAKWNGAEGAVSLRSGDRVAILSDGVLEAGLHVNREFGQHSVVRCCTIHPAEAAARTADRLLSEAARLGANDDMTAVVLNIL
jgi:sigma-B regulation protein RsbU (phosphoserine phosphatase)